MKCIEVELPDKVAEELDALVRGGWFQSEDELVRAAVADFLRHHRYELLERFHREDIAWALQQKGVSA
jgi:Arc/MetJ-type ribon-helix-helix transcriptional regulator